MSGEWALLWHVWWEIRLSMRENDLSSFDIFMVVAP